MDDIADKRLSKLSRGTGTLSGNLLRETPVYSRESIDEYVSRMCCVSRTANFITEMNNSVIFIEHFTSGDIPLKQLLSRSISMNMNAVNFK